MKKRKILSFALALSMAASVICGGVASASAAEAEEAPAEATAAAQEKTAEEVAAEVLDGKVSDAVNATDSIWISFPQTAFDLSALQTAAFLKTIQDNYSDKDDFIFLPASVIATRSVSGGTIYAVLCLTSYSKQGLERKEQGLDELQKLVLLLKNNWFTIFSIYEDTAGNQQILKAGIIDPEKIAVLDKSAADANAPWSITEKKGEVPSTLEAGISSLLASYETMRLTYIASVGVLSPGNEYRYLCYGTPATGEARTNLYVVSMTVSEEKSEITDVSPFDLNSYTEAEAPKDPGTVEVDTSETSPQTGHGADVGLAVAALLVFGSVAGVCVYKLKKKEN